jgi:hypothetical protein
MMKRLALSLCLLSALLQARAETNGTIRFPPHPRVLYTAAELAAFRTDPARAQERTNTIQHADRLKAEGLIVPDKEGNWIFYYACPADASRLDAESATRHVCPVCKTVYTDERTVAAYRTKLYYQLEDQFRTLALAYALSGNTAYAEPVRDAMLNMARAWPTFTRHDRWGRTGLLAVVGGRRFCQLLDEATSLIALAGSWDLIADAPCISADDRALIEKQLFRMPAEELTRFEMFTGNRNNHQTWFNAAYTVTGLALGDETLFRRGLYSDTGLLWQLGTSVTADGLWYEGAMAYHFYALSAIQKTLEAARRAGLDFSANSRLKSLWLGPLQMAYPDGQCPVFHDSDPANLSQYRSFFEWGAGYFHDPALAQGSPAALGSTNLAGIGVAVLRRGSGASASCAMLDYGMHGDGHGHPDKLNLVLYALGHELLLDPGRISYSVPEYKTWCRTTVAHNTVVIGACDQKPDTGRLLFFADTPAAAGALAVTDGAYPGAGLRRFLVLTDDLLIDVFSVRNASPALVDWLAHGRGTLTGPPELAPRKEPISDQDGYPHLTNLKEAACSNSPVPFTFTLDNDKFWRLWGVNDARCTRLITGSGIGYNTRDIVPFVMRRRALKNTTFMTVYDLSGTGSVTNISLLPVLEKGLPVLENEAMALRIDSATGSRLAALDLTDEGSRELTVSGKSFTRWLLSESKHCETPGM